MNYAELVLTSDTRGLLKAKRDLADVRDEGARTEKGIAGSMGSVSSSFSKMAKAAGALGAALGVGAALSRALTDARQFSRGLAEVSTLIEGTPAQMDALAEASKNMAGAFGTSATEQVSAFYQAISAGASTVEQAQSVLEAANKFAVGGVTSVTTGVDALTTAMNAYASSGLSAQEASDAMFVGIRAGKTTADELASALGKVVPIASSLGVSFDEVVGSTAALTKQGVSTAEAVTGIRQALSGIISPTKEAADEAERLGLNFSAEALADQGLTAFLVEVAEKTGGSQESLSALFGSVEALNSVMALTSEEGGAALAQIMEDMEGKAGQTQAAYEKMADSMDNRLSVATSQMSAALLEIGEAVLPLLVPVVEGAAKAVVFLVDQLEFGAGKIKDAWVAIEGAFSTGGIEAALDLVVGYVEGLGSRLVDALGAAGRAALDAALNIGVEIINGISAGIDRKFQDLKDKITGLGVYLPEWLKDMLGIASPSKVFAEIGEWTVEGLIVGMDDREDALRTRAETLGATMGEGIKDGLDPVLRTVFDGLARGDLGSIGSGLLGMAQQGFSNLLQTSFTAGGGGLRNVWQGITGAFTGIGDAYRGAGGGIGGIGAAISSMLPGIGAISSIVGVVQSVIGTTTKLTNALEGTLGIGGLLRGTEYDIKQRDNIFGSRTERNSEEIFGSWAGLIAQDLDQEFRDMVANTRDGIRALGLDINEAFTYDFDVQFDESLPHEQLMERLRQELNNANDELLRTSLAAAGLARDGESGAQTLFILNDSLRTANASLRLLDQSLFDVSAIGAGAARELIEIAGGMDAFANKTAFVFDNFLTTAEQDARALAIANENLAQTFDQLAGISIPETHAQFMALLDAQDLTTAAGRETYAALIDVADEFVTVNGTAQEAAEVIGDDLTPALEASTDAARELAAQQREQQSLLLQIARMTGNVAYIRQQELAALNEANRPLQEYIYLLEDQSDALDNALATARQALTDAEGAFDSAVNTLRALAQNAQDQLDAAEDAARRAFDAQKDLVRANFDAQINDVRTAADAQIEAALATVDALNAEREAAAERAASQAITVREQINLLEGILGSLDSALDNRRALTPEGRAMELAQAQAFLRSSVAAGGVTDPDALEQALAIVADPSTDLFNSFEDYAFDFKVNTGFIKRLRELTDDSLSVEEKTLQALEAQSEYVQASADEQIAAIEAARDAQIDALQAEMDSQLAALDSQLNALLGIDTSVLSIAEAQAAIVAANELVAAANDALLQVTQDGNANIVASLGSIQTALEAALAAMQAVDDAQDAVTNAGGGTGGSGGSGGGSSIPDFGPSSAGKRLLGILEGIDGASGVAALTEQAAFSAFSADRMNAILSDVGVAALSGSAAAAAQAFEDALGRNIDVAGLGFYTGVIDAQTDALGDLDAAMEFVRRDVQANGDQFEYAIQMMAQRLAPPIDATADAAAEAAVRDGAFQTANIGQLVAIQNGIFTLGSQIEGLAAAAVNAAAAAVPAVSAPTGGGASSGVSTASQLVNEALAGAANAAVGSVEESFYLAAAAEWTRRGGIPSYANGTDYHPGGPAWLHENEMVNLPRGTSVSTAGETRAMAESNLKIAQQTEQNAAELRQIRRFLQSLADIEEERRAEELAAEA